MYYVEQMKRMGRESNLVRVDTFPIDNFKDNEVQFNIFDEIKGNHKSIIIDLYSFSIADFDYEVRKDGIVIRIPSMISKELQNTINVRMEKNDNEIIYNFDIKENIYKINLPINDIRIDGNIKIVLNTDTGLINIKYNLNTETESYISNMILSFNYTFED